jgi:hypothetical protein
VAAFSLVHLIRNNALAWGLALSRWPRRQPEQTYRWVRTLTASRSPRPSRIRQTPSAIPARSRPSKLDSTPRFTTRLRGKDAWAPYPSVGTDPGSTPRHWWLRKLAALRPILYAGEASLPTNSEKVLAGTSRA